MNIYENNRKLSQNAFSYSLSFLNFSPPIKAPPDQSYHHISSIENLSVTYDSQFRRSHGAISLNESFQENTLGAIVMNQIECSGKTKASALSLL